MIKKIVLSFLIGQSIFFPSFSQENRQLKATYEFTNYSSDKKNIITLLIGKSEAFSEFKELKKPLDSLNTNEFDDTVYLNIQSSDTIGNQYYVNAKKIIFRDYISHDGKLRPFITDEKTPNYEWVLKNDSKKIGEFQCNLATLKFRGRDYLVWYTPDIPTPFGPWKFYGLPGLIVKIETSDNSISFDLTKLNYNNTDRIQKPVNGEEITFEDYVLFKNQAVDKFITRLKAKLPRGATVTVNNITNSNLKKNFN
jgi:GLPGLI family protein